MNATPRAWLFGGALWLVAGLVNHGSTEAIWLAADALIAVGIIGLARADLHSGSRPGAVGLALAGLGRAAFVAAELMAAFTGNDENAVLPVGALLTAIGLTLYGVAVLRAGRLVRPAAFAPLFAGIYPFAVMFPVVAATGEPSALAIAFWGVPIGLIGPAVVHRASALSASAR